jgi:hypothetical protein
VSSLRDALPNVKVKDSVAWHHHFSRPVIRNTPYNCNTIPLFVHTNTLLPPHHFLYFISTLHIQSLSAAEPSRAILTFFFNINQHMHSQCHRFKIIYSKNTQHSYMFQTSSLDHQGIHQSVHKTITFGLIVNAEELLVICHVVNWHTVDDSNAWMYCVTVHCTENYQQFFYIHNYTKRY